MVDGTFVTVIKKFLRKRDAGGSERGANLVEFALVAPIFFLLVFGMIEASALLFARNTLGLAASDAAREGLLRQPA